MKIVKLTAENVKRLRAVEITPDGNTVVISGRNGQGKTSVLDSIWFALGGGPATKDTSQRITDLHEQTRAAYQELTDGLAAIDRQKAEGLAAAKMPIDGLSFDNDGVTYQGIPFKQCSAAEQLRVSVAMAMALNPQVRVIRITDGSLLDSDNMRLIEEMAAANDYQCWVERVSDSAEGVGIYIEDGRVSADSQLVPDRERGA